MNPVRVKRCLRAALPRRERALGIGPQASGGHEIVGDGVPERVGLRLDETANGKKTEAVVLAVCVDPLDALAQSIDSLARFARHAFPPRLETDGLLLSLADTPRERGRLDVVPFAGRGRIDAHRTRRMSGERNDVFARGVACVDEQSVGGLAVAKRMKRALRLARRSSRLLLPGLVLAMGFGARLALRVKQFERRPRSSGARPNITRRPLARGLSTTARSSWIVRQFLLEGGQPRLRS